MDVTQARSIPEADTEQRGKPVFVEEGFEEPVANSPTSTPTVASASAGRDPVRMSPPRPETPRATEPPGRGRRGQADEAQPEPDVEHDVVCVRDVSTVAGSGFVVLELAPRAPTR